MEEKKYLNFEQFKNECFNGDAEAAFACLGREGYYNKYEVTLNHKNMRRILDSLDDYGNSRYSHYWYHEEKMRHKIKAPDKPRLLTLEALGIDYGKKRGMESMPWVLILWYALLLFFWLITGRNWFSSILFGVPAVILTIAAIVSVAKQKKAAKGKFYLIERVLEKKVEIPPKYSDSVSQYLFHFEGCKKKYVGFWDYDAYQQGEKFYLLLLEGSDNIEGYFSQNHWIINEKEFVFEDGKYKPKKP